MYGQTLGNQLFFGHICVDIELRALRYPHVLFNTRSTFHSYKFFSGFGRVPNMLFKINCIFHVPFHSMGNIGHRQWLAIWLYFVSVDGRPVLAAILIVKGLLIRFRKSLISYLFLLLYILEETTAYIILHFSEIFLNLLLGWRAGDAIATEL